LKQHFFFSYVELSTSAKDRGIFVPFLVLLTGTLGGCERNELLDIEMKRREKKKKKC